jgi:hypothetical protein
VFSINYRVLKAANIPYERTLVAKESGSTKLDINSAPDANIFGFDLTFTESPEMSIEYSQIVRGLEVINFKQLYDESCDKCSKTIIKTMNVPATPDTQVSLDKSPGGVTIEAHVPPFGDFEAGFKAAQTENGINVLAKFAAPRFGGCRASATYEVDGKTAIGYRNVSCNSAVLGQFSNNLGMHYTWDTNHDYWDFDSSVSVGSWHLDTSATWDISGENHTMTKVITHREIDYNGQHVEADLSLDYEDGSESDSDVAPYTLTIIDSTGASNSVNLFSRNQIVMGRYLNNVCGKDEECRILKIGDETVKYDDAVDEVETAFQTVEGHFDDVSGPAYSDLASSNSMISNYYKNMKMGKAFFRGGVPYWTVVPPIILVDSLPDIHNQFTVAKDFLRRAAKVGSPRPFKFKVGPIKKGMMNFLDGVYSIRDATEDVFVHPTYLSQNVGKAQKALSTAFSNRKTGGYSVPRHDAVGFAPSSGPLQLITFNNFNRAVPYGPAHCTWVASADLNGGVTSFVTGDSLIITLLDEVMKIKSDGSVSIFKDGSFSEPSSPFQFSMMQCRIGGSEVLNCVGVFSNLRVYQNGGVMAWYSDLQEMASGYNFRGLLGNPGSASARMMPRRGDQEDPTEAEFINFYELSKDPTCQVSRDASTHKVKKACRKAFRKFVGQVDQAELSAYQRACSAHANNARQAEPYTAMLASVLESRNA